MKILSLLFVLLMSFQFHAQEKWIGVPIFDKHLRLDKCQTCAKIKKDENLKAFNDSIWKNGPKMKRKDYSTQKILDYLKSHLPKYADSPERSEVIYHALMNLQEYLCEEIDYEAISPSDFNEYNQTIHQLLTLNPSNASHLHQRRMTLYAETSILDRISEEKISESSHEKMNYENWYDINNTDYIEGEDWKNLAKQYLTDKENANGFIPFRDYWGLNLGYISYGNTNENNPTFFQGIEMSLDMVSNINPLDFGIYRLSLFGGAFVRDGESKDSEILIYTGQIRNLWGLNLELNLIQFGVHNHHSINDNTWFWRPEVGFNIGVVDLTYAYNLPFNSVGELRGSQLKLGIGFPLIRVGKYGI